MRDSKTASERRGVNVAGYLRTESGVGAAARGYVSALQALGIPIALNDLSHLTGNRSEDRTLARFDADHPHDINIVCADVEPHFAIVSHLGPRFFQGHYNVGVWAWELPRFPEKWHDRFAYYDEIWVGTSFIANTLSPVSPIPVVRIPPVLTHPTDGSREAGRRRIGASSDEFVFLFIFDVHSHLERKNPMAAVEAFRRAFSPSEPVRLVLKSVNAHAAPRSFAALLERAKGYPISICDGYWPASEIQDLLAACDAYVSLHRSEGTGLTITDALALGKPVIATGWSGNMDFMSVANSFPVQYELVEIDARIGPYGAGEIWAEPSIEHAAALMRQVFQDREESQTRGELARHHIESGYSQACIAGLLRKRLAAIDVRRQFPDFRRRMWDRYWDYRALGDRIRAVASSVLPADATVAVVSRGDDDLLQLHNRRAWHFPQTSEGVYAGAHPANSADAVANVKDVQARGADFLLFPATMMWWLDYYSEFAAYLNSHCRQVAYREDACLIYSLKEMALVRRPSRALPAKIVRTADESKA